MTVGLKMANRALLPLLGKLKRLFSLREDTDEQGSVESIKKNVEFRSGNAWTLVFAIFIASVGLNVNSAAIIIGAMLISPLMGPIMGAGLALGTYDFDLLKRSGRNLGIAVGLSIVTSFLYFYLSPLGDAQSELLARTRPTAFDVLIAIFGGATGIIATSRREKGNAIPGVAIATALMPPLCTAGYGLASGQLRYFFGALYLFCINSVFICLSTYIFVRVLKFKYVSFVDPERRRLIKTITITVAFLTFLPSAFLAWYYVREASFQSDVNHFLKREFHFGGAHIVESDFSFSLRQSRIAVSLIGSPLQKSELEGLRLKLKKYGLEGTDLQISQSSLEQDIERRLQTKFDTEFSVKDKAAESNNRELEIARAETSRYGQQAVLAGQISKELKVTLPEIESLELTYVEPIPVSNLGDQKPDPKHLALVRWKRRPRKEQKIQATDFLKTRLKDPNLLIYDIQ